VPNAPQLPWHVAVWRLLVMMLALRPLVLAPLEVHRGLVPLLETRQAGTVRGLAARLAAPWVVPVEVEAVAVFLRLPSCLRQTQLLRQRLRQLQPVLALRAVLKQQPRQQICCLLHPHSWLRYLQATKRPAVLHWLLHLQ
jgi:hypothetical protein